MASSLYEIFKDRTDEKLEYQKKVQDHNAQMEQDEKNRKEKDQNRANDLVNAYWDDYYKSRNNYKEDHALFNKALNENTTDSYKRYLENMEMKG